LHQVGTSPHKQDGISHTGIVRVRTGKIVTFWKTRYCVFGL